MNRNRALWMTLLFYAMAGPLVGLVCTIAVAIVPEDWRIGVFTLDVSRPDFSSLSEIVMSAYVVGCVPTFVAGCLIGAVGMYYGRIRFGHAIAIGSLAGLVASFIIIVMSAPIYLYEIAIELFSISLIATIICWSVVRRWWNEAEVAEAKLDRKMRPDDF